VSYFRSRRKGRVYVEMPAFSALLIADLARQLIELLSDGEPTGAGGVDPLEELVVMDSPREPPTDPALLRLLPDAYPDDAEVAAEFRRFTEQSLRKAKIGAAQVVVDSLSGNGGLDDHPDDAESTLEFELDPEQARAWMRCLTDLRLTLAARLDVGAEDDETTWLSLPEDDPRGALYRIYGWLGFQLETLLEAAQR
jgi:Domain of unknown function (DUF2017)